MKVLKKSELCEEKPTPLPRASTYGDAKPGDLIVSPSGTIMVIRTGGDFQLSKASERTYYVYLFGPVGIEATSFFAPTVACSTKQ